MDLLLPRFGWEEGVHGIACAEVIRDLAAAHGVTESSYRLNKVKTTCILCGLCVRVCATKGVSAINTAGRGIEKRISIPFKQPPKDCIGCLSCAHICPTNTIRFEENGDIRKIWGRNFAMLKCEACGCPVMPEAQAEFEARRSGLSAEFFSLCPDCSRAKTVQTMATAFDMTMMESGETA